MNSAAVLLISSAAPNDDVLHAAERAALPLHAERAASAADTWLRGHRPAAILVDDRDGSAAASCEHVRHDPGLASVPVLGLSTHVSELPFEQMLASGADDLCVPNADTIAARLRHVVAAGRVPAPRRRGVAVIADPERASRILLARSLRRAGYDVTFAVDADEAVAASLAEGIELVVFRPAFPCDPSALAAPARARDMGCDAPWMVGVPPREIARVRSALAALPDVAVHDAFGPPENVLYVANELAARGGRDLRASSRLLYGTTILFRTAGGDADEIGYTFNISAGGLYVRTLAPPPHGADLWLELRPPRSHRRVRLEARVVWTRAFGTSEAATVPPGFGVQITGGSTSDLEWYVRRYRELEADLSMHA